MSRVMKRGTKLQTTYINLAIIETRSAMSADDHDLSNVDIPGQWIKVRQNDNELSLIRQEPWFFNEQRMAMEICVYSSAAGTRSIKLMCQGFQVPIKDLGLGKELETLAIEAQVDIFIKLLDSSGTGICCSFTVSGPQLSTSISHKVVNVSSFLQAKDPSSHDAAISTAFSLKYKVLAPTGQCCSSCTSLKSKEKQRIDGQVKDRADA